MLLKQEGKEVEYGVWESIWVRDKSLRNISIEVIFKEPWVLIEITGDVNVDRKKICRLSPRASQL